MDPEKDFPDLLWRDHEKHLKITKNHPNQCIIRTLSVEENAFLFPSQALDPSGQCLWPTTCFGGRNANSESGAFEAFNDNSFAISHFLSRCCTTENALRPTLERLEALRVKDVSISSEELSFKQECPSKTLKQNTALHR